MNSTERLDRMRALAGRTPKRDWTAERRAVRVPVADRDERDQALADLWRESC
jgi:hypothetical protein